MKFKLSVFLLLFSDLCFSGTVRVGVGVGKGDVDVSAEIDGNESYAGAQSITGSLYLGYILNDVFVVDLVYGEMTDDLLFGFGDNIHLDTYELLLGYRFNFEKQFYLEPKLGYSRWDIKLEEGAFLNPGPEQLLEDSGFDPLVMLTAGRRFENGFGASISYKYLDFQYGNSESISIGLDFEFYK